VVSADGHVSVATTHMTHRRVHQKGTGKHFTGGAKAK
jgi:hypothetical protein